MSTGRCYFSSPAKLNLFLSVLHKRSDGYHEVASLLQAVDLCDTLAFSREESSRWRLTCSDSSLPCDQTNLVVKALRLFRRKSGLSFGVHIHLTKRIPCRAGLGGGSSNAATTLFALNKMAGSPFSNETLMEWASEIGSDTPFFFSGGAALCTGRGEKIALLPSIPSQTFWLIKPEEGLATPDIYANLSILKRSHSVQETLEAIYRGEAPYFNDLERAAISLMPKLTSLKNMLLEQGFVATTMTGSGSALFCLGGERPPDLPEGIRFWRIKSCYRADGDWY